MTDANRRRANRKRAGTKVSDLSGDVALEHHETPVAEEPLVVLTWTREVNPRRLRRVAELLADILDNASTPERTNTDG